VVAVAQFLSPEWVEQLDAALESFPLDPEASVSVGHVVRDGEGGEITYVFAVANGRAGIELGPVDDADVILFQDYATAVAIARGDVTAQQALANGGLKLRGDVGALVRAGSLLANVGPALVGVRNSTTY